ncbi:BON domain-containing protein [Candidatus Heimdallarchaeota archaeon]|nr:MAG: BON domain-containing protein [Candidatus Heimdallarchaeota archaeon]
MTTDEEIKKKLTDQLYWDTRVDASDIDIDVNGSSVTLSGKVPNYSAKQSAVLDAWNISGVSNVNNNIKVKFPPKFTIPDDKNIKEYTNSLIKWNTSIDESDVDIEVNKGEITLSGTVTSYYEKTRAEEISSDVLGVREVHNELTVVPTDDILDKIVAENIVDAMDRNFLVDPEKFTVTVEKGIVTVTGEVPNYTTYKEAMSCIEHTNGVIDVQDNIRINFE